MVNTPARWVPARLLGVVLALPACDSGGTPMEGTGAPVAPPETGPAWIPPTSGLVTAGGAGEPSFTLPVAPGAWKPSQRCVDLAAQKVAAMSPADKAGQMIQPDNVTVTPSDVSTYRLGSLLSPGHGDPSGGNRAELWANMVNEYHAAAASFGIPLLYGVDAVHGHNNVRGATMFPHNIGLGCTRDFDLVRRVYHTTALEVRGTGIDWTFSPSVAAARDERWGRTFESFSEDPTITAWLGQAAVEGLQQGTKIADPGSILACAKHFAGDGATQNGIDQGNVILDDATFRHLAVNQYQPLINAGVATIMLSYNSYGASSSELQRVTGNPKLGTDLLKVEMGFAGIVISDYNAVRQLPGGAGQDLPPTLRQVAQGINAGLDMLMLGGRENWTAVLGHLQSAPAATGDGNIPQSRIDDAVTRILTVKCEMGMFDPGYTPTADSSLTAQIGSAEHRDVAREAVRKSLVVLKNENNLLPLPKTAKVLVAGTAADSMAKQCGGWTIDWQGLGTGVEHSADANTTEGTTILAAVRSVLGAANVTFSQNGTGATPDMTAAIVVAGENPYAEGVGDVTDVNLTNRSATDFTTLGTVLATGVPTVLVIVSGRPLIIDSYLGNANLGAVVAAWLPGTEGDGVADVLFGSYAPTGRLGHSWPRSMSQIPINVGDANYPGEPPALQVGYGLTW